MFFINLLSRPPPLTSPPLGGRVSGAGNRSHPTNRWSTGDDADDDCDGVTGDDDNGYGATGDDDDDENGATGNDLDDDGDGATGNEVDDDGMAMARRATKSSMMTTA
jgi:hypothetical protein